MQPHQGVESMTTQANIQATEYLINGTHPNIRHLETPCVPNHSSACRPGAKNTRENACTEGGCYKRRRDSVTLFCAAHAKENKCSKRDCEEIRVPDGQLCKKHTCDEPGCLLEVYPKGRNGKMCSEHQPCGFAGCRRPTILDADGHPKTLCAYHHLCRAPGPQCDGIVDGYSDYCQQHKCGVTGCHRCRDNERIPENRWCTPHTCIIEGCQERIDNVNDPNSRHFGSALITSVGDVGASLHDWKDPISARITHAAIEDAVMLPHVQEAVVSSTTVGVTTSLTVILMIPAAADDTDMTSRDAMLTPVVLDGSALATAVYEERKKNNTKTTGTISLEGEMSGMSALDIVGNDGMMGSTSRPHGGMGSRRMFHDNLGTLGMQRI
ncbi:hypothetical protein CDV36_013530 [Fusarium kuroshium]|uniref:Uncharacterized protein n=1 Tax=Fusarium kuroshium TaxID=2010991 RepID=A0A3M2RNU2_9HYPO|nr:hypothetical protein CDV36_013530 [Fusarium kuroshium]